jgi:hypothetical protein
LAKDKKSKAFFDSITEESFDSKKEIFGEEESESENESGDDNPFEVKATKFKDPSTIKKQKKVTLAFVQKTLSFISNPDDDQLGSHRRDSFGDDDSFTEDLHTLKQNSIIKIAEKTPERRNKSTVDLTVENEFSPTNLFKIPSLTSKKSFQNFEKENLNEVTVSTTAKTTSSSRASIMSFGKRTLNSKNREQRVLKVRKIASQFGAQSNRLKTLSGTEGFD